MTPEQALQILDNAAARAVLTRQNHQLVAEATATLAQFIKAQRGASVDNAPEGSDE